MDDKELLTKSDSFTPMMTRKSSTLTFDFDLPERAIPPEVEAPPIIIDGPNITMSPSDYREKPSWFLVWLFGLFLGISIGLLIAKSL